MFPFERPSNYGEMLNKIGMFTLLVVFGLTLLVAHCSCTIASILSTIKVPVEIWSLHVPVLYVVPALVFASLARIFRLHDKVSDLFGIRSHFDIYRILIPLCGSVGVPVDSTFRDKLRGKRHKAMSRTFYRYASFEEPSISKAAVLGAIDLWTWYWILLEAIVMFIIACIVLVAVKAYAGSVLLLTMAFICALVFATYFEVCGRRADAQIDEIVSDPQRASAIRDELNVLRYQM
jgi:hypothetical protein